jgi:hypothetical protein
LRVSSGSFALSGWTSQHAAVQVNTQRDRDGRKTSAK